MAKDGYRQLKTTAAQTAANAAVQLVEAKLGEGGTVVEAFNELFDAVFAKIEPIVDDDNALLEQQEASAPASKKTTTKAPSNPGDVVFTGGKFKGLTIAEVFAMDEAKAKADYGHQYGDGASYITGYVATPKNSNDTTRVAGEAFLAGVK